MKDTDINQRIKEIENRIALKELVDNFSILGRQERYNGSSYYYLQKMQVLKPTLTGKKLPH